MTPDLEKKLFDNYPDLTKDLAYLEVGDGWYDLIDYLFEEMSEFSSSIKFVQIKEKFGCLRAYYHIIDDNLSDKDYHKINSIISEYEVGSKTVCEKCGKKGGTKGCGGWLTTLCNEHYEEWKKKHRV